MLQHPRLETRRLEQERLPAHVEPAHPRVQRSLDVHRDARDAEATLLGDGLLVGEPLDLRVDEPRRRRLRSGLEDEQPPHHAELRRGQPHTHRVAHDHDHPLGLARELTVELADLGGAGAKRRIAKGTQLRERHGAAISLIVGEALALVARSVARLLGLGRLVAHGNSSVRLSWPIV